MKNDPAPPASPTPPPRRKRVHWLALVAALLVAVVGGYFGMRERTTWRMVYPPNNGLITFNVERTETRTGLPMAFKLDWVDRTPIRYPSIGPPVEGQVIQQGVEWSWLALVGDLLCLLLAMAMIGAAVNGLCRWVPARWRAFRAGLNASPEPDETLDGEPTKPGWDEAKGG